MSLKKQATLGFFWSFIEQFSMIGINFVVSIIMARLLLPIEFGLMGMIYVFFTIGNVLIDAGLTKSLIRTEKVDSQDYSTVFLFNVFLGFLLYIILFFTAPLIAQFYKQPILISLIRVYAVIFILGAFSSVQSAILIKQMRFKRLLLFSLPATILGGFLGIYFAYNGYGVWSLVYNTIITTFVTVLILWVFSSWRPKLKFDIRKFIKHFNFGYKLSLTNLIDAIFRNIYQIILGRFFLPQTVGYFSRSESMKNIAVSSISNTLTKVTFPLLANIQNDKERLSSIYKKILQVVIFIVAPVLIALTILAEPLFIFLFTEKWLMAVPYFQLICIGGILYPINDYNINLFAIIGRSDIILKIELIEKPILIALVLIALPYGIFPLLSTQIIYSLICFFINVSFSKKVLNYSHFDQIIDVGSVIIVSSIAAGVVYICRQYVIDYSFSNFNQLIIGISVFVMVYFIIAYFFKMKGLLNIIELIKK